MAIVTAVASPVYGQSVEIEVNDTATGADDYLCWTPVSARARLSVGAGNAVASPLAVTLVSESDAGGAVQFQEFSGAILTRNDHLPTSSLTLTLPADGSWKPFWVSGAKPSNAAKDVSIVAKAADGSRRGSLAVMVRVRKNANKLTAVEIEAFFTALRSLHDVDGEPANSQYSPYSRIHKAAADLEIHRSPLFLPWHRALLLDLERRLQTINPVVSVPYWRFDQVSTNLFVPGFMGETIPDTPFVPGPRFERWTDPELGRLNRQPMKAPADGLIDSSVPDAFHHKYLQFRGQIESQFHTFAHRAVQGWLASSASPADPLFFLLHSNVDRVWAHWQAKHDRFNSGDENAYSEQGHFPGSGVGSDHAKGVYAEDEMWPWTSPSSGTPNTWPPDMNRRMPQNSHGKDIPSVPTPGSMIDYLGVNDSRLALGYCYDDIDFKGRVIGASP